MVPWYDPVVIVPSFCTTNREVLSVLRSSNLEFAADAVSVISSSQAVNCVAPLFQV